MSNDKHGGSPFITMLHRGYLCVDLFFILSGFVIALTYARRMVGGNVLRETIAFLGHRLARVYPLYIALTLAMAFILRWQVAPALPHPHLIANIAMVQVWRISGSYLPNAWSISAEWLAYLLFPLLCFAVLRSGRAMLVAALTAAAVLWLLATLPDLAPWGSADPLRSGELDRTDFRSIAPLVRCLSEFTLGMAVFALSARFAPGRKMDGILSLGCVVAITILLAIRGTDFAIVFLLAVLVFALARDQGVVANMLGRAVPHYLGRISYSVYLVQDFTVGLGGRLGAVLARAGLPFHGPAAVTIVVATLLLSAASHRLIEKPARALIRGVADRIAQRRGGALRARR